MTHPDVHVAATNHHSKSSPQEMIADCEIYDWRHWRQKKRSKHMELQNFKQHYQIFKVTQKCKKMPWHSKELNNELLQNAELKFIEGIDLETHAWL